MKLALHLANVDGVVGCVYCAMYCRTHETLRLLQQRKGSGSTKDGSFNASSVPARCGFPGMCALSAPRFRHGVHLRAELDSLTAPPQPGFHAATRSFASIPSMHSLFSLFGQAGVGIKKDCGGISRLVFTEIEHPKQ